MTKMMTSLFAGVALMAFAGAPVLADDTEQAGTNVAAADPSAAPTAVSEFDAAMTTAQFGLAQQDPMILAGAARMMAMIGSAEGDGSIEEAPFGEGETGKPATDSMTEKAETAERDGSLAEGLFDDARQLARGNEDVLAMIDDFADVSTRGSVTGVGTYKRRISARSTVFISERYRGGELAEIALIGDGDTDVDLFVFDANNNEICRSTRRGDREYCSWTPAWTRNFTIAAKNYGSVYNQTTLITN